jgi:hypothetical protein
VIKFTWFSHYDVSIFEINQRNAVFVLGVCTPVVSIFAPEAAAADIYGGLRRFR